MNYIIIGSAGGLGSYLFNCFYNESSKVYGIDIVEGATVNTVLDLHSEDSFNMVLKTNFKDMDGPCTIIVSVANRDRARSDESLSLLEEDLSQNLITNPKFLIQSAKFLQSYAPQFSNESHLINIGSVLSMRYSTAESPVYGASKAATKSLVRDLSVSLIKDNICVNSISPALLYRDSSSFAHLKNILDTHKSGCSPTSYQDIYLLIKFIAESGIKSLRGKDLILDYGLEDIEGFDLLRTI